MRIEFIRACPDHLSRLRDDGYCAKCASIIPRRKAIVNESPESRVNRHIALGDWVRWRCPTHYTELTLTGLKEAGYCHQCLDIVSLRDADLLVHPVAQRLIDQELAEQYEKARAAQRF